MKKNLVKCFLAVFLFSFALISVYSENRKIDVWDFGGVESKGSIFKNNITKKNIDSIESLEAGKFKAGVLTFGDLSLNVASNDRLYYFNDDGSTGTKNYGELGYTSFDFGDGYISNGLFYCNGTGGEKRRYFLIKNILAGDRITFYGRTSNTADEKVNFVHVDENETADGKQSESAPINAVSTKYQYIALYDGFYKIYSNANAGKPVYYRVVRTPGVKITGHINQNNLKINQGYGLKFINKSTNKETIAVLNKDDSFSVTLTPGYEYTAQLINAIGFGITNGAKMVSVSENDAEKGIKEIQPLDVEVKKMYSASGTITGFEDGYNLTKLSLTFIPPKEELFQPVPANIDGKGNFNAKLEPDVKYTAQIEGVNDYKLASVETFEGNSDTSKNIKVDKKPIYNASGSFIGIPQSSAISSIEFINIEDNYKYSGKISNGNYSVKLRNGAYEVKITSNGYSTSNHIVINGSDLEKNIRMKETNPAEKVLKLVKNIYVGNKSKKPDFETIKEAVAAANAMKPASEKDRIIIHIAPGVYREQILIKTPYLTFINDTPDKEVKLTWYYGIGYKYFSANAEGYYDEDQAFDKYEKRTVARWGAGTYIKTEGKYFRAENIVFEASFNKYITDEEIEDGVVSDGSIAFVRKLNSDVTVKAATERSCALACEGDNSEFLNCSFIGSQDTLFTGTNAHLYFKRCFIEGNTDYIFGDGECVFDGCELRWFGYKDTISNGYIAVNKDTATYGYLFRNCIITGNDNNKQAPGFFGRPWGAGAKVIFMNTKLDRAKSIANAGWYNMSGNSPEKANYKEYNTTFNGQPVDVSGRTPGKAVKELNDLKISDYFGKWIPEYFVNDSAKIPEISKNLSITSNDDLNTPYPGHIFTVRYSLGADDSVDASLIQWFRVSKDGKETLAKVSSGAVDKTYNIVPDDSNNYIKVVVTPEKINGVKGKEKSLKINAPVREGDAKVGSSTKIIRNEGKINIFLAGDSTVKDYSAKGMYNAGTTRDEGAWGEFLQSFFNNNISILNYANGGRSTRNFINEGSLDKIASQIKKGDYLFIQFGHNDCSNSTGNLEDRFVPLGNPDSKGIYPVTAGKKVKTPASFASKYGETFYSYDCGGTFKWYLLQYIEAAKKAGATPVLITPVSRQYFNTDGTIRTHHDAVDTSTNTQVTTNNAYVTAMIQLAKEQNVLLIDAFEITKNIYEAAYKATNSPALATQVMFTGDSTHCNKLGGFLTAAYLAKTIKGMKLNISTGIIKPSNVLGENIDGQIVVAVKANGEFTAYTKDNDGKYSIISDYWTKIGRFIIEELSK